MSNDKLIIKGEHKLDANHAVTFLNVGTEFREESVEIQFIPANEHNSFWMMLMVNGDPVRTYRVKLPNYYEESLQL